MTKHVPTVSIGIPAYNEAGNIRQLLETLLSQREDGFVLCEIIVVSDGSTDATVALASSFDDPRLRIVAHTERRGQQVRQNEILAAYTGDILVLIEADTLPANSDTLAHLVQPLLNNSEGVIGMSVGEASAVMPRGFYERILWHNLELRKRIVGAWRSGDTVYRASGQNMRALSAAFARQLSWPSRVPEDAYAYFRLKELGFLCVQRRSARVSMRNVTNIFDRIKQVTKFLSGRDALVKHFSSEVVRREYTLPYWFVAREFFISLVFNPLWTSLVILELAVNRVLTCCYSTFNPLSTPHLSSKRLVFQSQTLSGSSSVPSSVSIGIPAYNEELNITRLLESLLRQDRAAELITEIIVVSDGSTDQTAELVRSVSDPRIRLIESAHQGLGPAQNKIMEAARGDVLVMLDADVLPADHQFLREIIRPLCEDSSVGLVGADTVSAPARTFFESVIAHSHAVKQRLYRRIRGGDTVYLCHGRARAFSRDFYTVLRWPNVFCEDAYSYLACLQSGYQFVFAPRARVIFRSPSTLSDHLRQSVRFFVGRSRLAEYFDPRFLREQFRLPLLSSLLVVAVSAVRHPVLTFSYFSIIVFLPLYTRFMPDAGKRYSASVSSKAVVYNSSLSS